MRVVFRRPPLRTLLDHPDHDNARRRIDLAVSFTLPLQRARVDLDVATTWTTSSALQRYCLIVDRPHELAAGAIAPSHTVSSDMRLEHVGAQVPSPAWRPRAERAREAVGARCNVDLPGCSVRAFLLDGVAKTRHLVASTFADLDLVH